MSEYELASLLQTQVSTIGAEIMDYFTILTAFLVAGFVAAERLSRAMAWFVTAMFVTSALFFVANVMGSYAAAKLIMGRLHVAPEAAGTPFGPQQSPMTVDVVADVALAMMLSGIVGGVFFFFQSRRAGRNRALHPAH